MSALLRRTLITLGAAAYIGLIVAGVLIVNATVSNNHRLKVVERTPNCAIVDAAVQKGVAADPRVVTACEASARGLIDSLSSADLARLKPRDK